MAAWIKANPGFSQQGIIGKWSNTVDADSSQSYELVIIGNVAHCAINGLTGADYSLSGVTSVTDNKWHHIACVADKNMAGNNQLLYVDGRLDTSASPGTNIIKTTTDPLYLGAASLGYNQNIRLNGTLDEAKIWNRSLTASEIANEYQMMYYGSTEKSALGTPAPDIPVALWHFDDNSTSTSAYDYFGDNQARISNATRTQGVYGGTGFDFNGTNAMLAANFTQTMNLTGNMTIITWVKTGDGTNVGYLLSKHETSTLPSYGILLNNTIASCQIGNSTSNQTASAKITPDNTWHQVACTYNTTTLAIYINGSPRNWTPFVGAINITTNGLFFGSLNGTARFFNGTIDEIEIYNRPFTADEINQSYRRQFPLFGMNSSRFGENSSLTFQIEPIQMDGTAGTAVNSSTIGTNPIHLPNATHVNITPYTPNRTTSVAGVWNYTAGEGPENGTTYTWFVNGTEAWRDPGLIGYWRLDGNYNDSSGQNRSGNQNTVSNQPTTVSGIVRSAYSFDGGDYINLSLISPTAGVTNTFSTWVKFDSLGTPQYQSVFGTWYSEGQAFVMQTSTNSILCYYGTSNSNTVSVNNFVNGRWYHIACAYNGSQSASERAKMYVNGINSGTISGTIPTSIPLRGNLTLGSDSTINPTFYLNGSMDEFKFYNRTLTASEVANEYQMMTYGSTEKDATGTPAPDIPVALWHFDDGASATSAQDFFGSTQARISNATPAEGMFGTNGIRLDGQNDTLITNYSQTQNLTGNMTLIAWVSAPDGNTSGGYIISKHSTDVLTSYGIYMNSTIVNCIIGNSTSNQTASTSIRLASFQHVACTYNTTELAIYLNGTKRNSTPYAGAINITSNGLYFGSLNGTYGWYNGTLDEVEIYNRPFTADEINQSYRRSFPLFGLNSSIFKGGAAITFQATPTQMDGVEGDAVNSSTLLINPPPTAERVNITPYNPNSTTSVAGVWNYTAGDGPENGTTWTWFVNNTEGWRDNALVGYWRLDGEFNDALGISNGTSPDDTSTPRNASGIIKGAMDFNGTTQYINLSNASRLAPSQQVTVSAWVKKLDRGPTRVFVSYRNLTGVISSQAYVLSQRSLGGTPVITMDVPSGDTDFFATVPDDTTYLNSWHHFAGTYDNQNVTLYIDGKFANTTSRGGDINDIRGGSVFAGRGMPALFNGSMDEIKIWNRSLTAAEIANEYQMMYYGQTEKDNLGTPAPDVPVAAWHFDDDPASTSAYDWFGDNIAVISNATRTTGMWGTKGMSFNGINSTLVSNFSQSMNLSYNFTWMIWAANNDTSSKYAISKGAQLAPEFGILIGAQQVQCRVYNGEIVSAGASNTFPSDSTLRHIACVLNSTGLHVYVGGAYKNTAAVSSPPQ